MNDPSFHPAHDCQVIFLSLTYKCAFLFVLVCLFGFGLFVAFYLDNSPPVISTDLSDWINKGKYMVFNRQKIFYRGKIFCNFDNFLLLNTNFTEFHHHMRFNVISEDRGLSRSRSTVICLHGFPTFSFDWTKVVYLSSSAFLKHIKWWHN